MRISKIFGVVYFLVGLYLVNSFFDLIPLPEFFISVDKWVLLIAGILVIISGIKSFFKKKGLGSSLMPLS